MIAIGDGDEGADFSERKWKDAKSRIDTSCIAIYPPTVAMISLALKDYPVAVLIDSQDIATAQQIIFDTL